jgi:uncharacterized protein (TIRG00374 family)
LRFLRSHIRAIVVLAAAAALLAAFLHDVNFGRMVTDIAHARPEWLAVSFFSMFVNMAIRAWRWQYLLEPIGHVTFPNAFRATSVGIAANSLLPARAGELIRPYFLSRHEPVSATAAFATIILERLLDVVTVLILLASFLFVFDPNFTAANPAAYAGVKWAGLTAGAATFFILVVLFLMAGNAAMLGQRLQRLEQVLPSALAGLLARVVEKFAHGLAAVRRPSRLFVALVLSFPLWLSIAVGIWAVAVAFRFAVPFSGSFLLIALLSLGVAVPTPGGIGGFHEAFRLGTTIFFGAPDDAAVGSAIVLHALSIGPALLLGLLFAGQAGMNLARMRELANEEAGPTA